ncbi:MAG: hypothetical protein DHS20C18_51420 [Saprospiraceae bacterium]|nr:MAG: hypothetical protein DHS20C18_51420 [Saprospiraceae bacterium]
MNPTSQDQHIKQILALDETWKKAASRHDLDGMLAIYAPDAQELLPDMPPIVGREAIREFYADLIRQFLRFTHQFDAQKVIVAESGDLAVVRGTYKFTADTLRPEEIQTGKFVGVWQYQNGDWRLMMNISNSN